ncbi:MAG: DUF4058 family protein [Armatimonadetes bacterium]|nr:DUF4058 family protein [Armatimonadota bacterium]
MPSPFPGMDPYLERPARWSGFHLGLIARIQEDLQPRLRPRYVAVIEERVYLEPIERLRSPDVFVITQTEPERPPWEDSGGGVAVTVGEPRTAVAEPEWVTETEVEQIREPYLAICDTDGNEVITIIEVLSPWNKTPGQGQSEYRTKQNETLNSSTNLVELDRLRHGAHTVAAPALLVADKGPADYLICTRRCARPGGYEVLRLSVRDPLPRLPVPLRPDDADVILDLASAFKRTYDAGAYDLIIDYTTDPEPPLSR